MSYFFNTGSCLASSHKNKRYSPNPWLLKPSQPTRPEDSLKRGAAKEGELRWEWGGAVPSALPGKGSSVLSVTLVL